jgi:hypothetical protein
MVKTNARDVDVRNGSLTGTVVHDLTGVDINEASLNGR